MSTFSGGFSSVSPTDKKRKVILYETSDDAEGYFGPCSNEACRQLLDELKQKIATLEEENIVLKTQLQSYQNNEDEDFEFSDDEESVDGNDPWSLKYIELREYCKMNGDCLVKRSHPSLGRWVDGQRTQKKQGRLSEDRLDKLNNLGFFWGKNVPAPKTWDDWYEELKQRKVMFGTCNDVPVSTPLGKWILRQRKELKRWKQGKETLLTVEKMQLLKDIGIKWSQYGKK